MDFLHTIPTLDYQALAGDIHLTIITHMHGASIIIFILHSHIIILILMLFTETILIYHLVKGAQPTQT